MTRALLPGRWNRDGRAVSECRGNCDQGRKVCDCALTTPVYFQRPTLSELDLELPHDASCTFAPAPPRAPRVHARTVAIAAIALIAFGLLLLAFPRQAESRALVMLVGAPR